MERRVVIIEDERDVSRLLEFNLRGAGFEVVTAGTGGEGLVLVTHNYARRCLVARHLALAGPPAQRTTRPLTRSASEGVPLGVFSPAEPPR